MLNKLARTLTIFLVLISTAAQATVFWDDEMESGNTGYGIVSGAMSYDTTEKTSGNGSVRLNYPSSCYPDSNAQTNCGGYMDRTFPATANFYRRFYIKLSAGFIISDVFTKLMRSDTTGSNSNWWVLGCCGSKQLLVGAQNVPTNGSTINYYTSATLQDNRWYCIETHEQLNTPGVANGVSQAWVDGVQVMNQSGIMYRQSGDNSLFNNNRMYRQTGSGSIWYDRVAVGDTRIGCSGSPPPVDPPPPPPPPPPASANSAILTVAADSSGSNLTFNGAAYKVRYWNDFVSQANATEVSGLNGVTSYRHNINLSNATFQCYQAQGSNGIWETNHICGSISKPKPRSPTGLRITN